jgi:hypothetical protein
MVFIITGKYKINIKTVHITTVKGKGLPQKAEVA